MPFVLCFFIFNQLVRRLEQRGIMSEIFLKDILDRTVNSDRIIIRCGNENLYDGYAANFRYSCLNPGLFTVKCIAIGTQVKKRQKYKWGVPVAEDRSVDGPLNQYDFSDLSVEAFLRIDVDKNMDGKEECMNGG